MMKNTRMKEGRKERGEGNEENGEGRGERGRDVEDGPWLILLLRFRIQFHDGGSESGSIGKGVIGEEEREAKIFKCEHVRRK